MIVIIDNYDSFTYNLVQYYRQLSEGVVVFRHDQTTIKEIENKQPTLIVLSPGPGTPNDSGICLDVMKHFYQKTPIFGVCLGMQVIIQFFGGRIKKANQPMHGKTSLIQHTDQGVFHDLPNPLSVARYHSLVADRPSFPFEELHITAETKNGEVMGVKHAQLNVEGIQFHPEAILTDYGFHMIKNSYYHALSKMI
ncbi:aminodeoxychorismate/anthranilate synthase component II [Gracilibacillus sp. YIM 98692]|uniref:anthranilate synthase component II n=1 Tax=Gracilibacillus sp. YIM 98692 TaxID=2663532 RepID=UPI0013D6E685|nr:aminodeoxychorismate/anthranilate synthase component II [Gracilibacillus sp. YIM 98692]